MNQLLEQGRAAGEPGRTCSRRSRSSPSAPTSPRRSSGSRSHLEAFEQACRTGEHAGRKLDFITQEMLREANTIASKANDAQIARHIVEIKGAIDRLKEQVQNVE